MDAERFWVRTGVVGALRAAGHAVAAPDRVRRPASWEDEAEHLAGVLPDGPITMVAGSHGCSAAVALALSRPVLVERLLLAWPVHGDDPDSDRRAAAALAERGADDQTADGLLGGQTLRGFTDDQLAALTVPLGVIPPVHDDLMHRQRTAPAVTALVPGAVLVGPATPVPVWPDFPPYVEGFVAAVTSFVS